jgi:hypothetical protein
MVDAGVHKYRKTEKRLHIVGTLTQAQDYLETAARAMEKDGHADHAHKTRNVAQSASARRCLMEQQWEMDDAAKRAARKEKSKK